MFLHQSAIQVVVVVLFIFRILVRYETFITRAQVGILQNISISVGLK